MKVRSPHLLTVLLAGVLTLLPAAEAGAQAAVRLLPAFPGKDVMLDFRNNLIYGYGSEAGYNYADFTRMNYVGNYVVPLPYSRDPAYAFNLGGTNARFFVEGNHLHNDEQSLQDWQLICTPDDLPHEKAEAQVRVTTPFAGPSVSTDPAEVAFRRILDGAGATLPARDAVDRRVLALIQAGDSSLTVTVVPTVPEVPIYVTLDGREPTIGSLPYRAPIRLSGSAHVRAKAIREGTQTTAAFAEYEKLAWHEAVGKMPSDLEPGLRYAYYETDDWDEGPPPEALKPVETGRAQQVDFGLHRRNHGYGLLFDGYLDAPRDGIYALYFYDNHRGRLYLDGQLVTVGMPAGGEPGRVALRAGKHRFHLRSLQETPGDAPRLLWQGPGLERQPVPATVFFWHPAGL